MFTILILLLPFQDRLVILCILPNVFSLIDLLPSTKHVPLHHVLFLLIRNENRPC
jgi:hypothetical protein